MAHFVSKLNDAEAENVETEVWLCYSKDLFFITAEEFGSFMAKNDEVGKLLHYMVRNPSKFM